MKPHRPTRIATLAGSLTLVLAMALGIPARPAAGQEKPAEAPKKDVSTDTRKQKEIADLERQIQELGKKLDELRKSAQASGDDAAKKQAALIDTWLKGLSWRPIGPANMGGRIVALSVFEADPTTYYAATASGGLLRTTNNGITFDHVFDREATVSIGDVCIAPSDRNTVWVGTGENNPRNSVSYGDGVYKSTDGGKTWANMGLKGSFQIGRILIHPKDPNIVYVGALGRLYGPSEERGLFKTTDGGKTWNKILFVDDKTGVIDMRMHPTDPETLIVASYERKRGIHDEGDPVVKWGPGSGLHRTTDGGKTFTKLTKGLPTVQIGRIGLDWSRKDPRTVFAIIETEKIGTGPAQPQTGGNAFLGVQGENREDKVELSTVTEGGPAEKGGLKVGDLITDFAGKTVKTYDEMIEQIRGRKAGDKVKVKLRRGGEQVEVEVTLGERPASGPGGDSNRPFASSLGGQRENALEKQGAEGFQTGGIYKSTDGGESWSRINTLNPRPFYFSQVRVDPTDENYLYVLGISLYRSTDGGKTFKPDGGKNVHADQHALWIDPRDGRHMIVGCDGGLYATYDRMENWDHFNHMALGQFYDVALDTTRDYKAYGGLQDNGTWGGPTRTRSGSGPINEDWLSISGGDGFQCQVDPDDPNLVYSTSQYGALVRRNLKTGEYGRIRPETEKGVTLVWNWNTPFILSSHNGRIYYCAANHVFKSLDRGKDLRRISPQITLTKEGSATALAESPKNPEVLYAGTDDGAVWVTRNGGKDWTDLTKKVGLPAPRTVATIEASRFVEGRVYVAFDGHRMDDDSPLLFVSEDFGTTWSRLGNDLPRGSTHCLREDIGNESLLYAGTEFAVWASLDRGKSWHKLNANLPTVAIFEIAVHPKAGEIVAATHGRSLWVLDVSALRQVKPEVLAAKATLFQPTSAIRWLPEPSRGRTNRRFVGENPPSGAPIFYALSSQPEKLSLKVVDVEGKTVRELRAGREPGLRSATWDLNRTIEAPRNRAGGGSPGAAIANALTGRAMNLAPGRLVPPGQYRVVLTVDGQEFSQPLLVEADPDAPPGAIAVDQEELEHELFDAFERDDDGSDIDF